MENQEKRLKGLFLAVFREGLGLLHQAVFDGCNVMDVQNAVDVLEGAYKEGESQTEVLALERAEFQTFQEKYRKQALELKKWKSFCHHTVPKECIDEMQADLEKREAAKKVDPQCVSDLREAIELLHKATSEMGYRDVREAMEKLDAAYDGVVVALSRPPIVGEAPGQEEHAEGCPFRSPDEAAVHTKRWWESRGFTPEVATQLADAWARVEAPKVNQPAEIESSSMVITAKDAPTRVAEALEGIQEVLNRIHADWMRSAGR